MAASTTTAAQLPQEQRSASSLKPLEQASVFLAPGPRIFDVTADGKVGMHQAGQQGLPIWMASRPSEACTCWPRSTTSHSRVNMRKGGGVPG
jgi:hypothetical protein